VRELVTPNDLVDRSGSIYTSTASRNSDAPFSCSARCCSSLVSL